MKRLLVLGGLTIGTLFGAGGSVVADAASPAPACPQVEGWTSGPAGHQDNGDGQQASCEYNQPGHSYTANLTAFWVVASATIDSAGTGYCAPEYSSGGSYWAGTKSKTYFAREEHSVSGATAGENAAVFSANRQRLDAAAAVYLAATEKLAEPCPGSGGAAHPPKTKGKPIDKLRVRVDRASTTSHVKLHSRTAYVLKIQGVVGVHKGIFGENDAFFCIPGDQPDRQPGQCATPEFFALICTGTAQRPIDIHNCVSPDMLARKPGQVTYSAKHVYLLRITGISGRLTLGIRDDNLVNNSGGWTVRIYRAAG